MHGLLCRMVLAAYWLHEEEIAPGHLLDEGRLTSSLILQDVVRTPPSVHLVSVASCRIQ